MKNTETDVLRIISDRFTALSGRHNKAKKPIPRRKISGFTVNLLGYSLEIVTVYGFPRVFAIWKRARHIYRLEF